MRFLASLEAGYVQYTVSFCYFIVLFKPFMNYNTFNSFLCDKISKLRNNLSNESFVSVPSVLQENRFPKKLKSYV